MTSQVASSSIINSSNVNTATIVPSLTDVNAGGLISVKAELNPARQGTTFGKDFYQQYLTTEYPQQINQSNITFQFSTTQFAVPADMVMQMCVRVTFTVQNTQGGTIFPRPTTNQEKKGTVIGKTDLKMGYWQQPSFPMLAAIKFIQTKLGSTNVVVGRAPLNYNTSVGALKFQPAIQNYYVDEELQFVTPLGLPFATGCSPGDLNLVGTTQNALLRDKWGAYLNEAYLQAYCNKFINSKTEQTYVDTPLTMTVDIPVIVPLKCLNLFFTNTDYLPPNIQMRFDIQLNQDVFPICSNNCCFTSDQPNDKWTVTGQAIVDSPTVQWVMYYVGQEAVGERMLQYNRNWANGPIVLKNQAVEYYDFKTASTSGFLREEIQISTECPTVLYMCVMNKSGADLVIPSIVAEGYVANITNYVNDIACGYHFSEVKIVRSGAQEIYFRPQIDNNSITWSNGNIQTAAEYINSKINSNIYKHGYENALTRSYFRSINEGGYCKICIDPSLLPELGYRNQDPGAVTINLSLKVLDFTNKPLDTTNYLVRVYRILEDATTIDVAGKVVQYLWPTLPTTGAPQAQMGFPSNAP